MKKFLFLLCFVAVSARAQDSLKRMLPPADYALLQRARADERPTAALAARLALNYDAQRRLQAEYDTVKVASRAALLYRDFRAAQADGRALQDSLSKSWAAIFDHKLYVNTFVLDRLGLEQLLDDQEAGLQRLNQTVAAAREKGYFDALPEYFHQKRFLLGIEAQTARVLGLTAQADSLARARAALAGVNAELPAPAIAERSFIEFVPITFAAARTAVQTLPVMPVGEVYRVLLTESRAAVNPLLFRGMRSVYVQRDQTVWRYVAGGYASYEQAEKAALSLRSRGWRTAAVVAWRAGVYDPRPTEKITVRDASGRLIEKEL